MSSTIDANVVKIGENNIRILLKHLTYLLVTLSQVLSFGKFVLSLTPR